MGTHKWERLRANPGGSPTCSSQSSLTLRGKARGTGTDRLRLEMTDTQGGRSAWRRGAAWALPVSQRCGAPTCDSVFNLSLHLEGVHVNGPVPDEACARDPPVRLAEAVLMVVVSGEDTACECTGLCCFFSFRIQHLFCFLFF